MSYLFVFVVVVFAGWIGLPPRFDARLRMRPLVCRSDRLIRMMRKP